MYDWDQNVFLKITGSGATGGRLCLKGKLKMSLEQDFDLRVFFGWTVRDTNSSASPQQDVAKRMWSELIETGFLGPDFYVHLGSFSAAD